MTSKEELAIQIFEVAWKSFVKHLLSTNIPLEGGDEKIHKNYVIKLRTWVNTDFSKLPIKEREHYIYIAKIILKNLEGVTNGR